MLLKQNKNWSLLIMWWGLWYYILVVKSGQASVCVCVQGRGGVVWWTEQTDENKGYLTCDCHLYHTEKSKLSRRTYTVILQSSFLINIFYLYHNFWKWITRFFWFSFKTLNEIIWNGILTSHSYALSLTNYNMDQSFYLLAFTVLRTKLRTRFENGSLLTRIKKKKIDW